MERELRYPIGVQSFASLRTEGYVYIDKTQYIRDLVKNQYYFLSRPRRFGKSLLLSTLEAYFRGRKELFEGLAVSEWERDWIEYPVIRVDFAAMDGTKPKALMNSLRFSLRNTAAHYGVDSDNAIWQAQDPVIGDMFTALIRSLKSKYGRKVVVLIDEYDKGLIETLHDDSLLNEATDLLRPFFSVLESQDEHIRFAFLTGVSRFRNTTVFSGANNLMDISLDPVFAGVCGISHEELTAHLMEGVGRISRKKGYDTAKTLQVLKDMYDGYRFTEDPTCLYNPFSLLTALNTGRMSSYWVQSGSSRVLATYLRGSNFSLEDLTSRWVSENELQSRYSTENVLSLFFQTGYLTIADSDGEGYYRLRIPNQEVQSALVDLVVPEFVERPAARELTDLQRRLRHAVKDGDVESMMSVLRSLISSVPYHEIDVRLQEKHLHLCMYLVFMMLGTSTKCEAANASGRVDMVATTPWRVYVFEFKIDGSADEALAQIDSKGYAIPWEAGGREVTKIGVNFSTALRTIDSWTAS